MKRILAVISAFSVLLCFSGCSDSKTTADDSTQAVTSAAETTTTTAKAAETTASETSETTAAVSEPEPEPETEAETDIQAEEEEEYSCLTERLIKRTNSWEKGNVIIQASVSEEGNIAEIYINRYENKMLARINAASMFTTTTLFDGEKNYTINDASKSYCPASSSGDDMSQDLLVSEDVSDKPADTGKETIDGKEYDYEEFDSDGEKIRYYFDDNGDVRYIGSYDGGTLKVMDFTVAFLDSPDESAFRIPDDYTEVSEDEMAMQLFAALLGTIGEMSGSDGDLSGLGGDLSGLTFGE